MIQRRCLIWMLIVLGSAHHAMSQPVVFPLHVGDRWEYTPLGGLSWNSAIVRDTLMPNGRTYAIRTGDYHYLYGLVFERMEGDKVFRYDTFSNMEQLWYNFDLAVNDTVNSFPRGGDTTDIILIDARVDTIFGVGRRTWWFLIDNFRRSIDDEQLVGITDSLGLTNYSEAFAGATLRGAVINGVRYGTITAVTLDPTNGSLSFQLGVNYPNPFNPSTTISYTLPVQSVVTLKVYNVLGREVATLVNGVESPGSKSVKFNGSGLPSGVYFYRLQAGSYSAMKMLVIVK